MRSKVLMAGLLAIGLFAAASARAGDFAAGYSQGVSQLSSGQSAAGIATLNSVVNSLGAAPAPDANIYTDLGWALMQAGRFSEAEQVFAKGYAQRNSLAPAARARLLNNMGLLSRLRGDPAKGQAYVQEAASIGSRPAQQTLSRLNSR